MPINLAPFVWKQILEEELTLSDLDDIDSYSVQVLRDLQQYGKMLSDEEFAMQEQYFRTALSNGEEVDLCEGGESKLVTKQNVDEFVKLCLEKRFSESAEAVKYVREGLSKAVKGNMKIFTFCSWSIFDIRATGEKTIEIDRLKQITTFNVGNENPIVGRFWRAFERMSQEERAAYLKFVWGRTRLPVSLQGLSYRHEVRLYSNLSDQGFPQAHTCFF